MVEISIQSGELVVEISGGDVGWALKKRLQFPLAGVTGVRVDAILARAPRGLRLLGSYVPGVVSAGIFWWAKKRSFWVVHHPEKALIIDLKGQKFAQLVLEVADPPRTMALIQAAI